jgi:hypothetical protein
VRLVLDTVVFDETDEGALQQEFFDRGWTDGLPVVIPVRRRVDEFLDRSGFAGERDKVVGAVPPSQRDATVDGVAVNALMAGCRPEHLGVVLAAVDAMLNVDFRLDILQVTTNPSTPMVILGGPMVDRLGIACEDDALGPGQHPNGAIGRAVRLVMRNIGGATAGIDHSTLGWPGKYTFCLGETQASPWPPFHATVGYEADEDVVTVVAIESIMNVIPHFHREDPLSLTFFSQYVRAMQATGTNLMWSRGNPVIVLSPNHAVKFMDEGIDRRRIQEELFERSKIPLEMFPAGNLPICEWTVEDGKVLVCAVPEDIMIVVAGGREGLHSSYMQPFGPNAACSAPVWQPGRGGGQRRTIGTVPAIGPEHDHESP